MGKDEELLLGMEKSDSDDVEEFKLAPPRPRKRRRNKMVPDARVASGGSSLVTWKCCFSFIVVSVLISGGLILAYFIYNMHNQINSLNHKLIKTTEKANSIFNEYTKKIKSLEIKHQQFHDLQNKHATNYEKLSSTVHDLVNKQNTQDSEGFVHHLNTLGSDVDAIKNNMAKNGAEFEKNQHYMLHMEDEFKKLQKEFNSIKVEALNPTSTQNSPYGANGPEDSNYMTRSEVNALLKKFSDKQVDEKDDSTKATLAEISDLKAAHKQMNVNHTSGLLRLTKDVVQIKNQFDAYRMSSQPIIMELKNATRDLFKQMDSHKVEVTALENKMKSLNLTITLMRTMPNFQNIHPATTIKTSTTTKTNKKIETKAPTKNPVTATNVPKTNPVTATKSPAPLSTKTATSVPQKKTNLTLTGVPVKPTSASTVTSVSPVSGNVHSPVAGNTTKQPNGPMLPNEGKMHRTNAPATAQANSSITANTPAVATNTPTVLNATGTPTHVYSSLPKIVKEQKAKENESETNYKKFQSNPTSAPTDPTSVPQTVNTDNERREEEANSRRRPIIPGTPSYLPNGDSYQGPTAPDYASPDGNYENPGGDGSEGNDEEQMKRMMLNSGINKLSDAERRELVQKFLASKGNTFPYNSGD